MTCDPSQVITQAEIEGLNSDIMTIDDVVESSLDTTVTKNGKTINTLLGKLKQLGYLPPVTYAGSIAFTTIDNTKTIDNGGTIYAPLPSALPFTTSGTWTADDETKFFVVQGLTLTSKSVPIIFNNTTDAIAMLTADGITIDVQIGQLYETIEFASGTGIGGARYLGVAESGQPANNAYLRCANGNVLALQYGQSIGGSIDVTQMGAKVDGVSDDTLLAQAAIDHATLYPAGNRVIVPAGVMLANLTIKDYITLSGAGKFSTSIKPYDLSLPVITTDAAGVERICIKDMRLTAAGVAHASDILQLSGVGKGRVTDVKLENVFMKSAGRYGMYCYGETTSGSTPHVQHLTAINCNITDCESSGLKMEGTHFECHFYSSWINSNGQDGSSFNIDINETGASRWARRVSFNGCVINGNQAFSNYNNVRITGGENIAFRTCDMEYSHFIATGDSTRIKNITLENNSFTLQGVVLPEAMVALERGFGFSLRNNSFRVEGVASTLACIQAGSAGSGGILAGAMDIDNSNTFSIDGTATVTHGAYYDLLVFQSIVSGAIRANQKLLTIDTEGLAATDDLDYIYDYTGDGTSLFYHGQTVTIKTRNDGRDVVIKHGVGNIVTKTRADVTLTDNDQSITLMWNAALNEWAEV